METPSDQDISRVGDCIRWLMHAFDTGELYYGHGTDNPQDEAIALVFHCLGLQEPYPDDVMDLQIPDEVKSQIILLACERVDQRRPLPYLVNEAWFAGLSFYVDERVIVPRSPFAEIINNGFAPWHHDLPSTRKILDLCCGSGCIGIAAAYALPDASIDLVDLSEDAIDVARINIAKHKLQKRVDVTQSDGFSALTGRQYDIILSNPPYVDQQDFEQMPDEYHCEPTMALVSGSDGLDLTRHILRHAKDYLTDGGTLFVEVGNSWEALEQAFPTVPFTWLEFEHGGHGVFVLTKQQLLENAQAFIA